MGKSRVSNVGIKAAAIMSNSTAHLVKTPLRRLYHKSSAASDRGSFNQTELANCCVWKKKSEAVALRSKPIAN